MTTITITLTSVCAGGNHLTFAITGDKAMTVRSDIEDASSPISDADAEAFCKVIARMAKNGRTVNQAKTLLQAGVVVSV